jgi:hypothetical protein
LSTPTTTENRVALRTANAIDSDDQTTINDALLHAQQAKKSKWIDNLIIHYTHEARLESYNYKRRLVYRRPHQEKHQ